MTTAAASSGTASMDRIDRLSESRLSWASMPVMLSLSSASPWPVRMYTLGRLSLET